MSRVTITQIHPISFPTAKYEVKVQFSEDKYDNKITYAFTIRGAKHIAKRIVRKHKRKAYEPKIVKDYGIKS